MFFCVILWLILIEPCRGDSDFALLAVAGEVGVGLAARERGEVEEQVGHAGDDEPAADGLAIPRQSIVRPGAALVVSGSAT